jgi:hypothetical protein
LELGISDGDRLSTLQVRAYLKRAHQIKLDRQLPNCSYESPESAWGACDGGEVCSEVATVHHLASDMQFCMTHFQEVQ